jgi:hypothetical protein
VLYRVSDLEFFVDAMRQTEAAPSTNGRLLLPDA